MKIKPTTLLLCASLLATLPACDKSYTKQANDADTGHRDEDIQDADKSVNDKADGRMGEQENQTESDK